MALPQRGFLHPSRRVMPQNEAIMQRKGELVINERNNTIG